MWVSSGDGMRREERGRGVGRGLYLPWSVLAFALFCHGIGFGFSLGLSWCLGLL
jgi:hypothetical protein